MSDNSSESDAALWDAQAGYFPTSGKQVAPGRRVFGVGKGMTSLARQHHVQVVDEKLLVAGITDC
jgi:hypothetical protein